MLRKLFLDEQGEKKIALFTWLTEQSDQQLISCNHLARHFSSSYTSIQSLLEEMNLEIMSLFSQSIYYESGKINSNFTANQVLLYENYLIENSLCHRFLLTALTDPQCQLNDFCTENYTSRATVFRQLNPVKKYLKQFDIKMNISQLKLYGNETFIRLFFYYLLWQIDNGNFIISNPQLKGPEEQLVSNWNLPLLKSLPSNSLLIFLKIARLRLMQNYFVPELTISFDEFGPDFLIDFYSAYSPSNIANNERNFFYYFLFHGSYYYDLTDSRLTHHSLPTEMVAISNTFFTKIFSCLNQETLSEEEQTLLKLNLINTFINYFVLHGMPPIFEELNVHSSTKKDFLYTIERRLVETAHLEKKYWILDFLNELTQSIYILLGPFEKITPEKIQIGLHGSLSYSLLKKIIFTLDHFQNITYIIISDEIPKNSDYILSAVPLTTEQLGSVECIILKNNLTDFKRLLQKISL